MKGLNMSLQRLLILAVVMIWPAIASAQASNGSGRWALRAGERTLMILDLRPAAAGRVEGSLTRPKDFQVAYGSVPSVSVANDVIVVQPVRGQATSKGLELWIRNREGKEDHWHLTLQRDQALLELADMPPGAMLQPFPLVRARTGEEVSDDLAQGGPYLLHSTYPSNPEMKAIFEADQADRKAGANIDWAVVGPRDDARRARTAELLKTGALQSGDDFWHAAFIFQHGEGANDYLMAHTLAVIAAARGRHDATWIAAATLDRYLRNIGQKQIYGTQFSARPGAPATQEPYDRTLISDALRGALGVPPLSAQEVRRAEIEAQLRAAAPR